MNESFLAAFSPGPQRVLRAFAERPSDAKHLIDRAQIFRGLLLIGADVMKRSKDPYAVAAEPVVLANIVALECAMTAIEALHPGAFVKESIGLPPSPFDALHGGNGTAPLNPAPEAKPRRLPDVD